MKYVGAKPVLLKICGRSCTHCTHTNEAPEMLRVIHKPVDDADFPKNFFLGNNPELTCGVPGTECFHYILDCYTVPVVFAFDPSQVNIFHIWQLKSISI